MSEMGNGLMDLAQYVVQGVDSDLGPCLMIW